MHGINNGRGTQVLKVNHQSVDKDLPIKAVSAHMARNSDPEQAADKAAELELIAAAKNGDNDAYGELVRANQDRIYASVVRHVRDEHRAMDITQEAFIQAFKALDTYEDRARFSTWLYRIAMNVLTSHFRHEQAKKRGGKEGRASLNSEGMPEPGASDRAPDELAEAADTSALVRQAIDELEDEYKQVVLMRDLQDMSYEEIAGILDIPPGTVRSRLHRGRDRLKEKLQHLM
jgi:RNA polymerase sigma-70 factor, ECF subfamily